MASEDVESAAERVLEDEAKEADQLAVPEVSGDRTKELSTPGFSRMNTHVDWSSDDAQVVREIKSVVEGRILQQFASAFEVMNDLYDIVREVKIDPATSEVLLDQYGYPLWRQRPTGGYIEDYTRLTTRQRDDLLFKITTNLFEWEQMAADCWGEAMFAKAQWEERFAIAYTDEHVGKDTIEGRTASGRVGSRDQRYFAIFLTVYSKRAEAVVRSMERLSLRLSQSLS